MHGQQNVKIHS